MRRFWYTTIALLIILSSSVNALTYKSGNTGQDISWPNCNNLNFKPSSFGIVGVNGGLDFHINKCLGAEAILYRQNLSLYVNTGFPGYPYDLKFADYPKNCDLNDLNCLAYNYGFNAERFSVNYSLEHGVVSNNWWLDVETINSWSNYYLANISAIRGELAAINISVKPNIIGIYSYPPGWQIITGNWKNELPNWVATNSNYRNIALNQCSGFEFTGGKTLLTQYIANIDMDYACN